MKKKYTCKLAKIAICIFTIASTCTKNDSRHNIKGENPQNSKSENEFPESEHEYPKSVHNSEQNNDTPLSNSGSHSGRYGFLDNKKSEESLNAEAAIGVLCYDDNDFFENLIGNSFNARNTSPGKSNMHFTGLPLTKANQTFFINLFFPAVLPRTLDQRGLLQIKILLGTGTIDQFGSG